MVELTFTKNLCLSSSAAVGRASGSLSRHLLTTSRSACTQRQKQVTDAGEACKQSDKLTERSVGMWVGGWGEGGHGHGTDRKCSISKSRSQARLQANTRECWYCWHTSTAAKCTTWQNVVNRGMQLGKLTTAHRVWKIVTTCRNTTLTS